MPKSAEVEYYENRIKELEGKLAHMRAAEPELRVLPNGDLHRGIRSPIADSNVEIVPDESGHPMNRAMANILKNAKGGNVLTCTWCGLQFDSKGSEREIRAHLQESHPSVVTPMANEQLLMASVADLQTQLNKSQ